MDSLKIVGQLNSEEMISRLGQRVEKAMDVDIAGGA